jgi:uncharacterized protein (DUF1778 family)
VPKKEKMVPVMVRMTPRTLKAFKVAAKTEGRSMAEFVREAAWDRIHSFGTAKAEPEPQR